MSTGSETLREGTRLLTEAGVPEAAGDARRLFAHALGLEPGRLTLSLPEPVPEAARDLYGQLIERRAAREPVSHLIGRRSFYGRDFTVTPDVLDPRPETEILVEAALARPFETVLDLGTGSGCILLTLLAEMPGTRGLGTDISEAALEIARLNAQILGVGPRARLLLADWCAGIPGAFDLIVSNPPYIAAAEMGALDPEVRDWEPRLALTDEGDGLGAYRAILAGAGALLVPGGRLLLEVGAGQAQDVAALARDEGFDGVTAITDLDGRPRVVTAETPEIPF